ncbi:hypothetical protein HYH03_017657 [Edaphochlamys debaryana]|uniref:Reticulon-like protein n=1 Tax=Edaphochlamys debaryana TaxID=47281 RepID=A0A836BNX7_9CHLO|nr:hypothetical protein HYH03_017657 [Edaphochlamys debaryana]|eukprot:KAG2483475.1 hypothetical protein HYH03_017657 [Edaphochlamys debaryana]
MFYECSCGFTATSATGFYKHLSVSKETGAGHQLVQARFSEKKKAPAASSEKQQQAQKPLAQEAAAADGSWVEEYLMVDDAKASSTSRSGRPPLPTSTSSRGGPAVDPEPEPSSTPKGWGMGRQRSGSLTSANAAPPTVATGIVDADEVELIEHVSSFGRGGRASSTSGAGAGAGAGAGGSTAQAALRMSTTMLNTMAVGLSPWRWFGSTAQGEAGTAAGDAAAGGDGDLLRAQSSPLPGSLGPEPAAGSSLEAMHAVRSVLTWQNPWVTGRIFGAGLYLAVCMRQLAKGHDLLQPSTALLAFCFLLLTRNCVRRGVASYRRAQAAAQQGEDAAAAAAAPSPREDDETERLREAAEMQQRVERVLRGAALQAARYGAAVVVLGLGLLSGRRAITSALVAGCLWLGMVLGELRLFSQPTFWLLCYVAVFFVPAAYARCREAMDAGVEAALRFVVRLLLQGSRTTLLGALGVGAVLMVALPLNIVLRASIAACGAFAVLLYSDRAAAAAQQQDGDGSAGEWPEASPRRLAASSHEHHE